MKQAEREAERINYIKILESSWTYARLTKLERAKINETLIFCKLYGNNRQQICEQLNTIYLAFLMALDYEPIGWREPNKNEIPLF